jgi:hypothetical protein
MQRKINIIGLNMAIYKDNTLVDHNKEVNIVQLFSIKFDINESNFDCI